MGSANIRYVFSLFLKVAARLSVAILARIQSAGTGRVRAAAAPAVAFTCAVSPSILERIVFRRPAERAATEEADAAAPAVRVVFELTATSSSVARIPHRIKSSLTTLLR